MDRSDGMRRAFLILATGAILTPLIGYVGALAFPKLVIVWLYGVWFAGATGGLKAALVGLIVPGLYGLKWGWPVTCVILPLTAFILPRLGALSPFVFLVIGAAAELAVTYLTIVLGLEFVNPTNLHGFLRAGLLAGAVVGLVFGFVLWRIDHLMQPSRLSQRAGP
jgi:hypothetical protein